MTPRAVPQDLRRRRAVSWLDRLSGGAWLVVLLGSLLLLMATFVTVAPSSAPPDGVIDGAGVARVWVLAAGVLTALAAFTVPAAFDAAEVARARVLPRTAPVEEARAVGWLVGGGTVAFALLVGVVTAVEEGSPVSGLPPALALAAWSGAVVLGGVAWRGAGWSAVWMALGATALVCIALVTSPIGAALIAESSPVVSRRLVVPALAGAAGVVALVFGLRRMVRTGPGLFTPSDRGAALGSSPRSRIRSWWRSRRHSARAQGFDASVPMNAVLIGQLALHTLNQLNGQPRGWWRPWGSDVTVAWPFWMALLVMLALFGLRGADLHWRYRVAPGGVRQTRLADALALGTLRWLLAWIGGSALATAGAWLLLAQAGASVRQQGMAVIAGAVWSYGAPAVLELVLAVVLAVGLRAVWPTIGPIVTGLVVLVVLGFAVLAWSFGVGFLLDAPVLGTRDLGHAVALASAAGLAWVLARRQWRRVGWLGQHLARRAATEDSVGRGAASNPRRTLR